MTAARPGPREDDTTGDRTMEDKKDEGGPVGDRPAPAPGEGPQDHERRRFEEMMEDRRRRRREEA
jgi:hypothetical protein